MLPHEVFLLGGVVGSDSVETLIHLIDEEGSATGAPVL